MKVFSTYFKVLRKNIIGIGIYLAIFLIIVVFSTIRNSSEETPGFEASKTHLTIINEDGENPLAAGLISYLGKHSVQVELKDEREAIQDALFFRITEYVLRIPDGFYEDFMDDGEMTLEKTAIDKSYSSYYMDSMINRYLNTWRAYKNLIKEMPAEKIGEYVELDIGKEVPVRLGSGNTGSKSGYVMSYYFNMAAYSTLSVIIIGIATVMGAFNHKDLKRRNECSPVHQGRMNRIFVLANLLFASMVFAVNLAGAAVLFGKELFTCTGFFMGTNLFIFTLATLSISMLVTVLVKSKAAQNAAANTISLGMCFIGGAFVPQFLLGNTMRTIASFTPAYWYIKANNDIYALEDFAVGNMKGILFSCGMVTGFAAVILAIALCISKRKEASAQQ